MDNKQEASLAMAFVAKGQNKGGHPELGPDVQYDVTLKVSDYPHLETVPQDEILSLYRQFLQKAGLKQKFRVVSHSITDVPDPTTVRLQFILHPDDVQTARNFMREQAYHLNK